MGVTARVWPAVFLAVSLEADPAFAMGSDVPGNVCLGGLSFARTTR
jgi:hypothetical protein